MSDPLSVRLSAVHATPDSARVIKDWVQEMRQKSLFSNDVLDTALTKVNDPTATLSFLKGVEDKQNRDAWHVNPNIFGWAAVIFAASGLTVTAARKGLVNILALINMPLFAARGLKASMALLSLAGIILTTYATTNQPSHEVTPESSSH